MATVVELQQRLSDFAISDDSERDRSLPSLVDDIMTPYAEDALLELIHQEPQTPARRELGDKLRSATADILKNPMWAGGYNVVVLNDRGAIVGGINRSTGRTRERYGINLSPALVKATESLHLDKKGLEGGLSNEANFKEIERLGLTGRVFLGEAVLSIAGRNCYIGTSGCELTPAYQDSLLPKEMRGNPSVNLFAGLADMVFARQIEDYIRRNRTSIPVKDPEIFSRIRRGN